MKIAIHPILVTELMASDDPKKIEDSDVEILLPIEESEPQNTRLSFLDKLKIQFGLGFYIAFLLIGLVQIYAGYLGIEYHWGKIWAVVLIGGSVFLRTTAVITIASFFGALDVWGWPWYGALAFAAPMIIIVLLVTFGNAIFKPKD